MNTISFKMLVCLLFLLSPLIQGVPVGNIQGVPITGHDAHNFYCMRKCGDSWSHSPMYLKSLSHGYHALRLDNKWNQGENPVFLYNLARAQDEGTPITAVIDTNYLTTMISTRKAYPYNANPCNVPGVCGSGGVVNPIFKIIFDWVNGKQYGWYAFSDRYGGEDDVWFGSRYDYRYRFTKSGEIWFPDASHTRGGLFKLQAGNNDWFDCSCTNDYIWNSGSFDNAYVFFSDHDIANEGGKSLKFTLFNKDGDQNTTALETTSFESLHQYVFQQKY